MFSLGSFLAGMLVAWLLEWLYVYLTSSRPRKNQLKQLEAQLQESEQVYIDETATLTTEIEALQAQVGKLTSENEVMAAEADGLRGELEVIQRPVEAIVVEEVTGEDEAGALDKDTALEEEFAAAMVAPPVTDDVTEVTEAVDSVAEMAEADNVVAAEDMAGTARAEDDLTGMTGIGPKTAGLLNKSGVTSFAQLAEMSPESLHEFLQRNNIPHSKAKVANWPEQAAKLAGNA